jgi:flagellar FliL protein
MADEPKAADGDTSAAKSKTGMLLVAIGAGAALIGGGIGALVVAPKLLARVAPADSAHASAETPKGEREPKREGKESAGRIFKLDNMIVNPAGSEGTRFLMASVAFELDDDAEEAQLKAREIELRDMVVSKLESLTMPMLTQPSARDSLKAQLGRQVREILGPKAKVKVYLPQFVIQ